MANQESNVVNINDLDMTKINTENVNMQFGGLSANETYLHYAVRNNDLEVRKMLLKKGADVNIPNSCRDTPLAVAIKHLEYTRFTDRITLKKIIQELINTL